MRLGYESQDDNNNQYPQIYSNAISSTSSERFYRQVNAFLEPLRTRGFQSVNLSSYLDQFPFQNADFYPWLVERIKLDIERHFEKFTGTRDIVFVWNINDITMLSRNHIEELQMLRPDINVQSFYRLFDRICKGVTSSETITRKVDNIEDVLSGESDAAPVYNALRELYNGVKLENGKEKLSHDLFERLNMLDQEVELCQIAKKHQKVYNQRWKYVKRCMQLVNTRSAESQINNYTNVVLCKEGVANGIAQILTSQLSSEVAIENIYSTFRMEEEPNSWYRMKSVVERLQQRFGKQSYLLFVTSGANYGDIPLHNYAIRASEGFKYLYDLQRDIL